LSACPEFVLLSQFELVAQQLDQVCPEDHHQMNKFLTLKTNATYDSGASHHQGAQQEKGTFTLSTITEMTKVGDVEFQHILVPLQQALSNWYHIPPKWAFCYYCFPPLLLPLQTLYFHPPSV
jgi:hypothetical protein